MLLKRLLVIIPLIPLVALLAALGGLPFTILIIVGLTLAAWEFWNIFRQGGYSPALVILAGGTAALILTRYLGGIEVSGATLALLVMISMGYFVVAYQRGSKTAALDLVITLGGIVYLGWLGGYIISLRMLPEGKWWLLLSFVATWMSEVGAYIIGSAFGKHQMAPRVSEKKSWEGYIGGILISLLSTILFAYIFNIASPTIQIGRGIILSLIISIITPLGDFGESVIKRQFGVKDASNLLPGHGGVMDRIDSWLWAMAIAYYLIKWMWC